MQKKEEVKATAAKATEAVKATAKTVETKAKEVETKAKTAAVKTEAKAKTAAKTVETKAKTAETKVKTAETKAKTAAKKTVAKAAAKTVAVKAQTILQYQNNEVDVASLEEKVKAAFVEAGNKASDIKTVNIYVKPEDFAAYYVINGKFSGRVDLF